MKRIGFLVLIVCLRLALMPTENAFECDYLPNKCKFENTYAFKKDRQREVFVCDSLDKSFDFSQQQLSKCKKTETSYTEVYFRLAVSKILDNSFQASSTYLFVTKMNAKRNAFANASEVSFKNLKGFDLNSSYVIDVPREYLNFGYIFSIYDSEFAFYMKGRRIDKCDDYLNINLSEPKSLFQVSISNTKLVEMRLYYINYGKPICPLFFNNTNMLTFSIFYISNTFYKSNLLQFEDTFDNQNITFNTKIDSLWIYEIEQVDINSKFLNTFLFSQLTRLSMSGEINSIQDDLFRPFKKLEAIFFEIEFFDKLTQKGTKWINSINSDLHVNVSDKSQFDRNIKRAVSILLNFLDLKANDFSKIRLFPDENFCLFKDYPFDQLVIMTVSFLENITKTQNISCTLLWIIKDLDYYAVKAYSTKSLSFLPKYYNGFLKVNRTEMQNNCAFEQRLRLCKDFKLNSNLIWTINDTREIIFLLEFILILAFPIISLVGILSNILVVLSISLKDNRAYVKERHYSYMRMVSVCNILVLLIALFNLVYECQTWTGIYCPRITETLFAQYYRIVFVEYLSSVLKMLSNFAYVGFCISRLSLIGKDHAKFIKWISKLSIVKFMIASLIFSASLSSVKIFRYQVNTFDVNQDYPTPYDRNLNNAFSGGFATKARIINVFNAICDVTNYLLFIIVNLSLDITLVIRLKKTLDEKMNSKKQENEKIIIKLVGSAVTFAIFSILLKLPSSIKSVFDSIHLDSNYTNSFTSDNLNYIYEKFCVYGRICPMIEKFVNLLYNISISANILFYHVFDKKFKIGFRIAISKLFSSKQSHLKLLKYLDESAKFTDLKSRTVNTKIN